MKTKCHLLCKNKNKTWVGYIFKIVLKKLTLQFHPLRNCNDILVSTGSKLNTLKLHSFLLLKPKLKTNCFYAMHHPFYFWVHSTHYFSPQKKKINEIHQSPFQLRYFTINISNNESYCTWLVKKKLWMIKKFHDCLNFSTGTHATKKKWWLRAERLSEEISVWLTIQIV